jgi:hypothetical protein
LRKRHAETGEPLGFCKNAWDSYDFSYILFGCEGAQKDTVISSFFLEMQPDIPLVNPSLKKS